MRGRGNPGERGGPHILCGLQASLGCWQLLQPRTLVQGVRLKSSGYVFPVAQPNPALGECGCGSCPPIIVYIRRVFFLNVNVSWCLAVDIAVFIWLVCRSCSVEVNAKLRLWFELVCFSNAKWRLWFELVCFSVSRIRVFALAMRGCAGTVAPRERFPIVCEVGQKGINVTLGRVLLLLS